MAVNLFDVNFYRAANPDLASFTDAQAWQHFQTYGLNEGRRFSPFVNLDFYRANNSDLRAAGLTTNQQVYDHLRTYGVAEGRRFSEFLDLNYYLALNPDVNAAFSGNREQAFNHLRTYGVAEGRLFSPFVDLNYYLALNPDVNQAYGGNRVLALQHLEIFGIREGRQFISTFNTNFYRNVYPDLVAAGLNNQQLLIHFESYGLQEGRASSETFNVQVYLANNPDLRAAGFNNQLAYEHFLKYGQREGRPGADYAGNAISAARSIGISSSTTTFTDFVGYGDANDYYRFSLNSASNFNLLLNGLAADVDVNLLNSSGEVIQTSNAGSTDTESINRILDAGTYYLQVYQYSGSSNYNLNLAATVIPYLTVLTPNGGETFQAGLNYNITWTDNISENVKLDLYKGGAYYSTINSSTLSDGSELWTVPTNLPSGSDYQIRIASTTNGNLYDFGNNYFTVSPASFVTLTSPNGGETFQAGLNYNITWTDNISENVKLDLYKGGAYYSTINSSTLSDGSELWTVPTNLPSGSDYQIRIASTTNGNLYDFGNNYFTVSPASFVTLTSPNGGNFLIPGLNYNITWNDNISENVRLDLYKGGAYYSTINSSTPSSGSYTWSIPTGLPNASDYQIRISSTSNGNISDYSDTNFSLQSNLQKYWFYYNMNPTNYQLADSYVGSIVAPAGMYTVAILDGSYVESDFFDPNKGSTETGLNGKYLVYQVEDFDDRLVNEAGRVFVNDYIDRDNGVEQHFTPYKYAQGVQPSGLNYLGSESDYIDPLRTSGSQFGQDYYEADPEPSNWKAEYYNNRDLSGSPVFIESFGSSQSFERQWGNDSPTTRLGSTAVPTDSFSARVTSTRYLAPGLYQVRVNSDDGVRVKAGNLSVVNSWIDQGSGTPHSGYFRWAGGQTPITVEYYENGGNAALKFDLIAATPFQDPVDEATQWRSTVYTWDRNQASAPPVDFFTRDEYKIGVVNLGSNTRSDGQKGISFNVGTGALKGDANRLPDDFFAVRSYTWADFDGGIYNFKVRGDDGYQIFAKSHATNQWYDITSQTSWDFNYGAEKVISAQLPAGRYDLHFQYYEQGGDANFDLSWAKASNPDIDIQIYDAYGAFTGSQWYAMQVAVDNWEKIITKDKDPSGVLRNAVTEDTTSMLGTPWGTSTAAEAWMDNTAGDRTNYPYDYYRVDVGGVDYDNRINWNAYRVDSYSTNLLIRIMMHEIGHTLGLDHETTSSLMNTGTVDQIFTSSMFSNLESLGYGVDRNAVNQINWYG